MKNFIINLFLVTSVSAENFTYGTNLNFSDSFKNETYHLTITAKTAKGKKVLEKIAHLQSFKYCYLKNQTFPTNIKTKMSPAKGEVKNKIEAEYSCGQMDEIELPKFSKFTLNQCFSENHEEITEFKSLCPLAMEKLSSLNPKLGEQRLETEDHRQEVNPF